MGPATAGHTLHAGGRERRHRGVSNGGGRPPRRLGEGHGPRSRDGAGPGHSFERRHSDHRRRAGRGARWSPSRVRASLSPRETDSRIGEFTESVATAIANAGARDELSRLLEEQAAHPRRSRRRSSPRQPRQLRSSTPSSPRWASCSEQPRSLFARHENERNLGSRDSRREP